MMMRTLFLILTSLAPLAAQAVPYADCAGRFRRYFDASHVQKINLKTALEMASSEGYLQGRELRSAQLKLERAQQIYSVYRENMGGTATDLVVADRDCTMRDVIRVQEN